LDDDNGVRVRSGDFLDELVGPEREGELCTVVAFGLVDGLVGVKVLKGADTDAVDLERAALAGCTDSWRSAVVQYPDVVFLFASDR